jgi:PPOX class probable FMN-dependent enzyme
MPAPDPGASESGRVPHAPAPLGVTDLATLYRPPHDLVLRKQQTVVDEHSAAFVRASSLVVLATTGPDGPDASPRGGPPGFVRVLAPTRLAFGDLSGNNRLDSYRNLVRYPGIGMLFIIAGMDETLRVNGRAELTTEADVLDATTVEGRRPKVAVVVTVTECFVHCAKAFRRGKVWEPDSWATPDNRPSPGAAFAAHLDLDASAEVIEADLDAGYRASMWEPGGG